MSFIDSILESNLKPNRAANRQARSIRKGSSKNVFFGSKGVRISLCFKS